MLAAVVVPHPPILVPALAAGAAADLAPLLEACDRGVAGLLAQRPQTIVCIGSGAGSARFSAGDWGTLAGFGVPIEAPDHHERTPPALPLSLTIGRWLLERAGWAGRLVLQEVAVDAPSADCRRLGRELAGEAGPDPAWLVLGDGSNRRGPQSPGHDDPRAETFDTGVAEAFATADVDALLDLDAGLASELGVTGRAGWQVLAGAVAVAGPDGGQLKPSEASVLYQAAPYGVGYLVADWWFGS